MLLLLAMVGASRGNKGVPFGEIRSCQEGRKEAFTRSEFLRRKRNYIEVVLMLLMAVSFSSSSLLLLLFFFSLHPPPLLARRFPSSLLRLPPCPFGSTDKLLGALHSLVAHSFRFDWNGFVISSKQQIPRIVDPLPLSNLKFFIVKSFMFEFHCCIFV